MRFCRQEEGLEDLVGQEVEGTGRPGGGGGGLLIPRAGQRDTPGAGAGGLLAPRGTQVQGPVTVRSLVIVST